MNHHERAAADRLEAWLKADGYNRTIAPDLRLLLAALRRHDRLASEGLTEEDQQAIAVRDSRPPDFHPWEWMPKACRLIAKLQAQLAAAKDATAVAEGIAGDALEDRGLARLEEVRRETAAEIAGMVCWCCEKGHPFSQKGLHHQVHRGQSGIDYIECRAASIRRRFGLTAPADPQHDERRNRRIEERTP